MEASRTTRHPHTRELRLNRRAITFLICLAISALGWILISLSEDYIERQQFHLVYSELPPGVLHSTLPDTVLVEYTASGFNLLFHDPIGREINVNCSKVQLSGNGQFYFLPSSLVAKQFNRQFGLNFQIIRLLPDTIRLVLGSGGKEVPVVFTGDIRYKGEVLLADSITIEPSRVRILGDGELYNTITTVQTQNLTLTAKEGFNTYPVALVKPGTGIEFLPDSVNIRFRGEKFTEREFTVPVTIMGLPAGYSFKPVPKEVKIKCLVPFSVLQTSGSLVFTATVDYKEISGKQSTKARLKLSSNSIRLKNIRSQPESVDFILRKSL